MHVNLAARRIEHQTVWKDEQIRDRVKMVLPAGEHIYEIINHFTHAWRYFCFIRVLDPETMHKKNDIADTQFEYSITSIFKLTEEYVLISPLFSSIKVISTATTEVV